MGQEEVVETAHEDEQNSNNADDRDLDDMMADNDDTENCEPASQTTEDVIKDTPAKVCPEEKPAPVTPEKPAPAPKAPVKTKEPAWLRGVADDAEEESSEPSLAAAAAAAKAPAKKTGP